MDYLYCRYVQTNNSKCNSIMVVSISYINQMKHHSKTAREFKYYHVLCDHPIKKHHGLHSQHSESKRLESCRRVYMTKDYKFLCDLLHMCVIYIFYKS